MIYIQIPEISRLISRQKNIRHLSWMKRFLERVQQISNAPARLADAINALQAAVGGEDQAYLIITKSDLTAPIEEADKARDNTYSGISSMLDALSRLGTADQQQAASRVAERVAYHKVSINDRYEDESEKITQLVQDFKAGSLAADIATLGLTATVCPMQIGGITMIDMSMMVASVLLLWLFSYTKLTVARWEGAVLTIAYLAYLGWLLYNV